jgi:ACT domain-containing protein
VVRIKKGCTTSRNTTFCFSKLRVCVSGCIVDNALLVGTVDRVDDIGSAHAMQLNFSLSRTDSAIAIAETFHLYSTPSLIGQNEYIVTWFSNSPQAQT